MTHKKPRRTENEKEHAHVMRQKGGVGEVRARRERWHSEHHEERSGAR